VEETMAFSLIPTHVCSGIYDIDWQALAASGVKLVLADLDNTLIPYSKSMPDERLKAWKEELETLGMTLFVLSNSRRSHRCPDFCKALGVPCRRRSKKPSTRGFTETMARFGVTPEQTVMLGDQIFTDVLGANRAGVPVWAVRPIEFGNMFRLVRYGVELPFRAIAKRRESR
jgi:HAD superfamily phosphatase (TIGR01668 family)